MRRMKQASLGLGQSSKPTRRRLFLEEMDRVVPWNELVALITAYMPEGRRGRPPFAVEVMLRIHFMQQWFNLSDPAMEEALHDMALFRDFAGLGGWNDRQPDETTILRFRRVLEKHKLAHKILGAPCSPRRPAGRAAARRRGIGAGDGLARGPARANAGRGDVPAASGLGGGAAGVGAAGGTRPFGGVDRGCEVM
jgi:hypothetical protein